MALLTRTKIDKNGNWRMSSADAKVLAADLIYAAEEAEDHESVHPLHVGGFECKSFYIYVNPFTPAETDIVVPEPPKLPPCVVINEADDPTHVCSRCHSTLKRGWFGAIKGCRNQDCDNYWERRNFNI